MATAPTPTRPAHAGPPGLSSDLRKAAALVVDGNPTTRMTLAGQLRTMGLTSVSQASRIAEARRELERHQFDVVVCGDSFPKEGGSGQELLDDLRRSGLLPYATVFILLTTEATYLKVAEAAESSVDSYIVRPYSAGSLVDRIEQARQRKAALYDIYRALEAGRPDDALALCRQRFEQRGPQWLQAARLGAEILLRLERFGEAAALFQQVWDSEPRPWALLGVARAQLDGGAPHEAQATLTALIEAEPDYPDAYDVLGRVQTELGHFQAALENLEKAVELTPMAIGRQQRLGMLAYFCGNRDKARELLERSTYLGLDSKMFDSEGLVLLALSAFEHAQPAQVERHLGELRKRLRQQPHDVRLQRFVDAVGVLSHLQQGHTEKAANQAASLCRQTGAPDFDMEAACNLLTLLSLVQRRGLALPDDRAVVEQLGRRFATSKAMGELLANAAHAHTAYADLLRTSQDEMVQLIERAVRRASQGEPEPALQDLARTAQATLNARAVESAWLVLQRYRAQLPQADAWQQRIGALRTDYGTARNKPALGDRRLRPSGGVNLGPLDRPASPPADEA
ncbi:response regulator [Aquabacterium sp. A08]|uniref:response regulator n=1 Tax=Aquabacterium sp. A08 TaxID=2718532 RepID=UPI00141F6628|nr:response regulator [Aquabacterium sp. A08]